jgi:adenosine kinase
MVANISAANNFTVESFKKPEFEEVLNNMSLFYITGFFLTVSPDTFYHIGEHCKLNNKVFCMNLSAPFLCQFFKEPMLKALEYVDILFGNESEALAFAESNGLKTEDVLEAAKLMSTITPNKKRTVVVT